MRQEFWCLAKVVKTEIATKKNQLFPKPFRIMFVLIAPYICRGWYLSQPKQRWNVTQGWFKVDTTGSILPDEET